MKFKIICTYDSSGSIPTIEAPSYNGIFINESTIFIDENTYFIMT